MFQLSFYYEKSFNSETCRRRHLTDAVVLSYSGMALQLTAHAMQDWLRTTAVTLLQSMNGNQTRQILICFIIICGDSHLSDKPTGLQR